MLHICKFNLPKIWRSQFLAVFSGRVTVATHNLSKSTLCRHLATPHKTLIKALAIRSGERLELCQPLLFCTKPPPGLQEQGTHTIPRNARLFNLLLPPDAMAACRLENLMFIRYTTLCGVGEGLKYQHGSAVGVGYGNVCFKDEQCSGNCVNWIAYCKSRGGTGCSEANDPSRSAINTWARTHLCRVAASYIKCPEALHSINKISKTLQ